MIIPPRDETFLWRQGNGVHVLPHYATLWFMVLIMSNLNITAVHVPRFPDRGKWVDSATRGRDWGPCARQLGLNNSSSFLEALERKMMSRSRQPQLPMLQPLTGFLAHREANRQAQKRFDIVG